AEARTLALDGSARLNTVVGDLTRLERLDSERAMSEQLAIGHEIFSFIEGGFVTFNEFIKDRPELLTPEVIEERDRTQQDVNAARRRFESAQKSENLNAVRNAIRLASLG